jgi:hypothetical protein
LKFIWTQVNNGRTEVVSTGYYTNAITAVEHVVDTEHVPYSYDSATSVSVPLPYKRYIEQSKYMIGIHKLNNAIIEAGVTHIAHKHTERSIQLAALQSVK